jgi:hypothetical protein
MTGLLKLSQISVDNFVDKARLSVQNPYESRALLACAEKQHISKSQ